MNYRPLMYLAAIIIIMYLLKVEVVVTLVDGFKDTWNYFVEFVTTFRYKQPLVFIALPVVAVWCLKNIGE